MFASKFITRTLPGLALAAALTLTACSDNPTAPDELAPRPDFAAAPADASLASSIDGVAQLGFSGDDRRPENLPHTARAGDLVPGVFIVIFKDDVADAPGLARRLTAAHGGTHRQTFEVFKGFSAKLPPAAVEALRRNPNVDVVEPVRVVSAAATQYMTNGHPWGLDRIDQRSRPLSGSFTYGYTGAGVHAYIIDSGIRASHAEFGGRARNVATVFGDNGDDCHGHGTHVAGTVGGATYGVAKAVRLYGVKVLNCFNSGTSEGTASGIDWVFRNRINPAVANISIHTATPSAAVDRAATNLANSGVFVAVAAGNRNMDACNSSPARAAGTFTVAASTAGDARWTSSNWGPCVDAYAPGHDILSAGISTYWRLDSGTSMAAPHVAGVAAQYKQAYGNVASSTIVSALKSWSTTNIVVNGGHGGTPNRLLFKGVF